MKGLELTKYLSAYACISMCLFDGNAEILKVKAKMDNPKNFTKVAAMSFVFYTAIVFVFSLLSYLAFGQNLQAPIIDNAVYYDKIEDSSISLLQRFKSL